MPSALCALPVLWCVLLLTPAPAPAQDRAGPAAGGWHRISPRGRCRGRGRGGGRGGRGNSSSRGGRVAAAPGSRGTGGGGVKGRRQCTGEWGQGQGAKRASSRLGDEQRWKGRGFRGCSTRQCPGCVQLLRPTLLFLTWSGPRHLMLVGTQLLRVPDCADASSHGSCSFFSCDPVCRGCGSV